MSTFVEFKQALLADQSLAERFEAERKRIADSGEVADDASLLARAAEAVGFELAPADIERLYADAQDLSDDELGRVSGGTDWPPMDRNDSWCVAIYCCYTALAHPDRNPRDHYCTLIQSCWSDYTCVFFNN